MQKRLNSCIKRVVDSKGDLVALIFDVSCMSRNNNTVFVPVPDEWGIHVGVACRERGYSVGSHYHKRPALPARISSEVLIVLKGKIVVKLYSLMGEEISTVELGQGEGIVMRCGHSVDFLEDSIVLEIKEGPYPGVEEDKIWFNKNA